MAPGGGAGARELADEEQLAGSRPRNRCRKPAANSWPRMLSGAQIGAIAADARFSGAQIGAIAAEGPFSGAEIEAIAAEGPFSVADNESIGDDVAF